MDSQIHHRTSITSPAPAACSFNGWGSQPITRLLSGDTSVHNNQFIGLDDQKALLKRLSDGKGISEFE